MESGSYRPCVMSEHLGEKTRLHTTANLILHTLNSFFSYTDIEARDNISHKVE